MIAPSGEYAESRPFKIFISLLDKWEIGALLTEALVLNAFKSIKHLAENPAESGEDVSVKIFIKSYQAADARVADNDSQHIV